MTFNFWTFLLEVVNFLVLAYVLKRLLYRPLREAIDKRRQAHEAAQAQAEKARDEALALEREAQAKLAGLDQERQELLRQAHEQAAAERKKLFDDAERAVRQTHEAAHAAAVREREETLKALHGEVIAQAVELSRRLLAEAADAPLDERLAGRLVEKVETLSAADREQLRSNWHPQEMAVLETARALDNGAVARISGALAGVLGQAVALSVQQRSDLIAGARLRLGGRVWDASLAAQLEGIPGANLAIGRPAPVGQVFQPARPAADGSTAAEAASNHGGSEERAVPK